MNIFAFDDDPELSALWLDDIRSNKMIVESCQLLSTTMNLLDPHHGREVYKTSFLHHPCAVWTRESALNFFWLVRYVKALLRQRSTPHKAATTLLQIERWYHCMGHLFDSIEQTPFVNCAANQSKGVSFKHIPNTCYAYRLYIRERWKHDTIKLTWNNGEKPWWAT